MTRGYRQERSPDQIAADQAFLAEARSRSPHYPDILEGYTRLQRQRETIAARIMLGLAPAGLLGAWHGWSMGWAVAGVSLVAFAVICLVAGNREYVRNGGRS